MRPPLRRVGAGLAIPAALALLVGVTGTARAALPPLAHLSLAEALATLQAEGLPLVFTSELVRPEMRVEDEPASSDPRAVLAEILAPHGLTANESPGGILVVVRAARPVSGFAGSVLRAGSREPVAEASVRIVDPPLEVTTGPAGEFSLEVPPGRYTVEAAAEGFLPQRLLDAAARAGPPRRIEILLYPRPFVEDEIVIRPSRSSVLRERPDSALALSREEIAALPHLGGDAFRLVSTLPGTATSDVSAGFSVHGGRRDEVRIVLDGQELYEAFHLTDYDDALSVVPAHALEEASLATGGFPASQGDRMSGVLDLATAEPRPGFHLLFGASVLDVLAAGSGTFANDRGGWFVSARRGTIDLAREVIDGEDPAFWDGFAKVDVETPSGRWGARVLAAVDELEVDKVEEEDFERVENDYRRRYAWIFHRATVAGRALAETALSWADLQRSRRAAGSEEDGEFGLRDDRSTRVVALVHSWDLQLGRVHRPQGGFELRRYETTLHYEKDLDPALVIAAPFSPPRLLRHSFDGQIDGDHVGLWAADRLRLGERMTGEVGFRYDRHTATDEALVSPRVNLAWRLGDRSVLRAAWGHFFQSQRPYELQVEDGRTELSPAERNEHLILGLEAMPASRPLGLDAIRLELFTRRIRNPRARYENLLEPMNVFQELEPDRVGLEPEEGRARGAELLLRGRTGARLDWWLVYARARSEERYGNTWVPTALDQPHTVTVDLTARLPKAWTASFVWRYHTGWPWTPVANAPGSDPDDLEAEADAAAAFGPLRSRRLPTYHRLDVRVSRRWRLPRGALTLFLDVQNLYDRKNLAGFDVAVDEEGDGAASVALEEEHWPGTFPSLGVVWEY